MAFNMKRPIIKGTPLHKASIAKATSESIVAQTRTQADGSLVAAGQALGRSYVPAAIDYSRDSKAIKIPKGKKDEDEDKTKKVKKKEDKTKKVKKKEVKKKEVKKKELKKYVEEAEDEDNNYSGIENDNSDTTDGSSAGNKFYKNWKFREDEKNIKEAKANKKEQDEASKKRTDPKKIKSIKPSEVKTKDANYKPTQAGFYDPEDKEDLGEYMPPENKSTTDNQQSKPYQNFRKRQEQQNIIDAEANKAKIDAESEARRQRNTTKVNTTGPKQLPSKTADLELKQAGEAPEITKTPKAPEITKTPKAHENPKYKAKGQVRDSEGRITSLGQTPPQNPGYSYNEENDQWTYNDIPVDGKEVPEAFVDGVNAEEEETRNIDLNSNTPSADSTSVDIIPQPPTATNEVEEKQVRVKPKPSDFRPKKNAFGGTLTANEQYQKALKEYNSKSPMEMRDDRIYRNALENGPVRKNMIKGGYTPQ